jgi:histidyl-tRNA synthetase
MKPTIPQGTRDFGPEVVRKADFYFKYYPDVFELYGFQPFGDTSNGKPGNINGEIR